MSDDLRLNSVDRFSKRSQRLILEEHGHCEVPAGCGGVVMRWRNPRAGMAAIIQTGFADMASIQIDGVPLKRARVTIPDGDHLLTIHAEFGESQAIGFWLAALRDLPSRDDADVSPLVTSDDGTWLATFSKPLDHWQSADFDDSGWTPLSSIELDPESITRSQQWSLQRMDSLGAQALDINEQKKIWIRKRFFMRQDA